MLKMMPISFSGIKAIPIAKRGYITLPKTQNDCFIKSNVSFCGVDKKSSFENWMNDNNLEIEDIKNIISNEDNILGAGFDNTTFSIPNCDEYVLRCRTWLLPYLKESDFSNTQVIDSEDKTLKINIGQQVASIYPKVSIPFASEIEVLKKQSGSSIGVQPPETIKENDIPYEDYSRKEKYEKTINKTAKLPQKAYDTLVSEIMQADETGYKFDYLNSNNLLVDEKNERINIIDMQKGGASPDVMSGLLYALTNIRYFKTYTAPIYNAVSDEKKQQVYQDTMEIIGKFVLAMKNQNVKFDLKNMPLEASMFLFSSAPFKGASNAQTEREVMEKLKEFGVA